MQTEPPVAARLQSLRRLTRSFGAVTVAFSGGVDSSLVLAVAAAELGPDRVLAATAVSASLPLTALDTAASFAADLGVRHVQVETSELGRPEYARNDRARCSHCKSALMDALEVFHTTEELADRQVLTGANADDTKDPFRPGVATATSRGARHPLAEVAMSKADVRAASRALGLPTWDRPAAPCLASRIAYGVAITATGLRRVDAAEAAVRHVLAINGVHSRDLRVRDLGTGVARIEVDAELVAGASRLLPAIESELRGLAFATVAFASDGFVSGSLNLTPLRVEVVTATPA